MDLYVSYGQYFVPDSWFVVLAPYFVVFMIIGLLIAFKVKKKGVTTALVAFPVAISAVVMVAHNFGGVINGEAAEGVLWRKVFGAFASSLFTAIIARLMIHEAYKHCSPNASPTEKAGKAKKRGLVFKTLVHAPFFIMAGSLNLIIALVCLDGLAAYGDMSNARLIGIESIAHHKEKVRSAEVKYTWFEPDTLSVHRSLWNFTGPALAPSLYTMWTGKEVYRPKIDQIAAVHVIPGREGHPLPIICGFFEGRLVNVDYLVATSKNLLEDEAFSYVTDLCPKAFPEDVELTKPDIENLFKSRESFTVPNGVSI